MPEYAEGGIIKSDNAGAMKYRIKPAGKCAVGHTIWEMDGVLLHIISSLELEFGDYSQLFCPNVPVEE